MADQTPTTDDKTIPNTNPIPNSSAKPDNICLAEGSLKNSAAVREFNARYGALRRAIGANIEHVRKDQDMPLKKLAKKTGISAERLDYWEMGRMEINLTHIIRIAAALGVSQATLLNTGEAAKPTPDDIPVEDNPGPEVSHPDPKGHDDPEEEEDDFDIRDSFETQIDKAVAARERRDPMGFPDKEAISAMEEPMYRVMGAAALFYDYATALTYGQEEAPAIGLVFLSQAVKREADRVYRLYFGHPA